MRNVLITLALACSASLSMPASAANIFHHPSASTVPAASAASPKPKFVRVEFRNPSGIARQLVVGDMRYELEPLTTISLSLSTGSAVQVYSDQESRLHGQTLLTVTPEDAGATVLVQ